MKERRKAGGAENLRDQIAYWLAAPASTARFLLLLPQSTDVG